MRYGNDVYWAELPEGHGYGIPVDVWADIGQGLHQTLGTMADKFWAIRVIDALIAKEGK